VQLNADVAGKGSAIAVLESYNGSNAALNATAQAQLTEEYFVQAAFSQPNFVDARSLNLEQGAIITGKVGYKVNPYTMMIVNYRKAYDPTLGKVVETQWYDVSLAF
jgi:hypothetical protein